MNRLMMLLGLVLAILVVVMLGIGGYWIATRPSLFKDAPFPSKDDQVRITVERPDNADEMTIANKSAIKLKVLAFNADDSARLIPRTQWTLEPAQSTTYARSNYRFKVVPEFSGDLTIANKSAIKLKVLAFNADDSARLVPRAQWTLEPGQSTKYARNNYRFKAFKPAIFDELKAESGVIGSDVTVSGDGGTIRIEGSPAPEPKESGVIGSDVTLTDDGKAIAIAGSPKKPVTFASSVPENLKVCVYNKDDAAQIVPLKVFSLGTGTTAEWPEASAEFTVKVFRPQFLDKPLATQTNVRDQSTIKIDPKPE